MVNDLATALLDSVLTFVRSRLEELVRSVIDEAIADGKKLLEPLLGHIPSQAQVDAYLTRKNDIEVHLLSAKAHVVAFAAALEPLPTTIDAAKPALDEAAAALKDLDDAIVIVAEVVPEVGEARAGFLAIVRKAIADVSDEYAGLAKELAIAESQVKLPDGFSTTENGLAFSAANSGARNLLSSDGMTLTLSKSTVEGHFDYRSTPVGLGVSMRTGMKAGLVSDGLVAQVLPGSASIEVDLVIGLDANDGLTIGAGARHRLPLPAKLSVPGVDLRDLGLELPKVEDVIPTFTLSGALASKLGALGTVVDDLGLDIELRPERLLDGGGPVLDVGAHLPTGVGLAIDAGIVKGGGYLFRRESVYGGALDLRIGPVGVKAIGFVDTDPFSMVVVMAAEFTPAIQLGFGFTLNGVGGLLAIDRTVSSDALVAGLRDHTADLILFPKDPVGSAPAILDLLSAVFPAQQGALAVGPMFELGWGAPISFVTAKVGVILSLPDPRLIVIGDVRMALPSPDAPLIDLRASVFGELTPHHVLIIVSLSESKIAGYPVSGDIGVLLVIGGEPSFAISAGGFHPSYQPPAELAGLRRLEVDLSPPVMLTLRAQAYVALTSNSVQFGARVHLKADAGVVGAEGHLAFDALVQWAPRFLFIIDLDAGIALYAIGESFAGVTLHLHLEGPGPWVASGSASVSLLFFDIDLDVGPITWGEAERVPPPAVSPVELVADAIRTPAAWTARLPEGADQLARLRQVDEAGLVVHPLGAFEVRQSAVPLETTIQRVGRNPVTHQRVVIGPPLDGAGNPIGTFSHVNDRFAPGQYLDLPPDQLIARPAFESLPAGIRIGGGGPASGRAVASTYQWETTFPHRTFTPKFDKVVFLVDLHAAILANGLVASRARQRGNAYTLAEATPIVVPGETFEVRSRDDLATVAGIAAAATAAEAFEALDAAVALDPSLAGALQVVTGGLA